MKTESPVVFYPVAERAYSREELAHIIGSALESNPKLAAAWRQVLQERLGRATIDVAYRIDPNQQQHAAGRISEILTFQTEFDSYLKAARELSPKSKVR